MSPIAKIEGNEVEVLLKERVFVCPKCKKHFPQRYNPKNSGSLNKASVRTLMQQRACPTLRII